MTDQLKKSRLHAAAWIAILMLGVLMLGAGLFILGQPVDAADFEGETGIAWEEYQTSDPEAADYLVREARLLGVSFAVLGGVAAAVAATLLRAGNRTAWAIVWFIPVAFIGSAAVFYSASATALGSFYTGGALVAVIVVATGQRTARR